MPGQPVTDIASHLLVDARHKRTGGTDDQGQVWPKPRWRQTAAAKQDGTLTSLLPLQACFNQHSTAHLGLVVKLGDGE